MKLGTSLIPSLLDYCIERTVLELLHWLPVPQRIQYIIPQSLHWLPILQRIQHKIDITLLFQSLHWLPISLILSRLDYCIERRMLEFLHWLPVPQRIQYIIPQSLHWLPILQRIQHKIDITLLFHSISHWLPNLSHSVMPRLLHRADSARISPLASNLTKNSAQDRHHSSVSVCPLAPSLSHSVTPRLLHRANSTRIFCPLCE